MAELYRTNNPLEYDDVDGIIIDERAPDPNVQGVPANIACLVGRFQRGPENELVEPGSIGRFLEIFGKSNATGNLEIKNKKFGRLRIIRAVATGAAKATLNLQDDDPATALVITAKYKGAYGNLITVKVETGTVSGKKITITDTNPDAVLLPEIYDNVSTAGKTNTQLAEIFGSSQLVDVTGAGDEEPANLAATVLAGGADGTAADTDYEDAIAVAEQESSCNVLWTDKYSATIKGYLELHVQAAPDKMVIVAPDSVEADITTPLADVVNYRDTAGRIIYAFNALQTRINGVLTWTSPASWIASIISNTSPHIDPAFAENVQYTAGATDIRHKLSRTQYIQLKDAGVCAFEFDKDLGGFKPRSGIVTQIVNSSKVTILRRRMADFYTESVAKFLKNYQNAPNTKRNRTKVKGAIVSFDDGLINDGILPSDAEVIDGKARLIDTESQNTNASIAAGLFKILIKRRIFSSMRYIVLQAEIGESVVVTEAD